MEFERVLLRGRVRSACTPLVVALGRRPLRVSTPPSQSKVCATADHVRPRDELDSASKPRSLAGAGDHPSFCDPEVGHALPKPAQRVMIDLAAQLDLDRHETASVANQEIYLGAG